MQLKITEPTTLITDYLIFVESLIFFIALFLTKQPTQAFYFIQSYWLFLGMGGLLGGTSHGFKLMLGENLDSKIWTLTLFTIGISTTSLFLGISTLYFVPPFTDYINLIMLGVLTFYIYKVNKSKLFRHTVVFYGFVMVIAFLISSVEFIISGDIGSLYLILGFITVFLASFIQVKQITLHKNFNHNDLFHVVSMIGAIFMYLAFENLLV